MGGIRGKPSLVGKRSFQPRKSRVKHRRQAAQFVFGVGGVNALRQIAGSDFYRRGADIFDRLYCA